MDVVLLSRLTSPRYALYRQTIIYHVHFANVLIELNGLLSQKGQECPGYADPTTGVPPCNFNYLPHYATKEYVITLRPVLHELASE